MTEEQARNLIEEELTLKMLGPGYAKDLIVCSPDASDEIIPENPRYAYTLGVLMPQGSSQENTDSEETLNPNIDNEVDDDEVGAVPDEQKDKLISGRVENDTQEQQITEIFSHIGLITCLSSKTNQVRINISYGTYKKLEWQESINQVKVITGHFSDSIQHAIDEIGKNRNLMNTLEDNGLPEFSKCFVFDCEKETLSLEDGLKQPQTVICIPNAEFPVEASLINLLFGPHYKRKHHSHELKIQLNERKGERKLDENVRIYWNIYEAGGKCFIKVLMQSIATHPIYQPEISVTAIDGEIISYVEPITVLNSDEENNINEFVYRNVHNYGKGVNCAIVWDNNCQRVYTTFTPRIDVEKYSNEVSNDSIDSSCTLRNLSIWSEFNNDEIIECLEEFIDGYKKWHYEQIQSSEREPHYQNESKIILDRQKELLERLKENVSYLKENDEAIECFKIANTAMLLQMVVARHPDFKKNRDCKKYKDEPGIYEILDFFENAKYEKEMGEPKYRPFQLAFLLMNIKSTFDLNDKYHTGVVDLIWFPTGGGKTEAYLALTALTIVQRRRRGQESGVSVIMRYTLRMLTSQQFERASYLICALEFLRQKNNKLGLGKNEISIGIYVGAGVTPNTTKALKQKPYDSFFKDKKTRRNENPFPVSYCPWCGNRMVSPDGQQIGYFQNNGMLCCINQRCTYRQHLPIYFIDEQIYDKKPTLLFATVDKLAQLYRNKAATLFSPKGIDAPDLIIQDELHLLVGALGSIVGLFESIVESLISRKGRCPKIIASTATTRNTKELIKDLYNRDVFVFPPQGLEYKDNYFSHVVPGAKRRHIGMMPLGNTNSNTAEIRLAAFLLLARVKVFKRYIEELGLDWRKNEDIIKACRCGDGQLYSLLDKYWTSVFYFNSLKDLGRSRSRVSQEVSENFRAHKYLYQIPGSLSLLQKGFDQRVLEFTSRIESSRIKSFLTEAETPIRLRETEQNNLLVESGRDLIYASNMISVGIDIARWNLMVMVGQPRSTSEYVQSSSRVARDTYGLVINLLNPLRLREHSLFENYRSFHATYYKSIEPLSITPLTEATIRHNVLNNIIKIYRDYILCDSGVDGEDLANAVIEGIFRERFAPDDSLLQSLRSQIENFNDKVSFATSLRDITEDAFISINQIRYQ